MNADSRSNDLIVKYTPPSILAELLDAFADEAGPPALDALILEADDGQCYDLNLPGFFPGVSRARALERRREIRSYFRRIRDADVVVITLGLIEGWKDEETGRYVCGLPAKRLLLKYPKRFALHIMDYEECRDCVRQALEQIHRAAPHAQVILTTSPVPLARTFSDTDVIVANCYSKSTLRAVCGKLSGLPYVDYFPSYEMVMHSQFASTWAEDQLHVTDARVGRIMRHFVRHYVPDFAGGAEDEADGGRKAREIYLDARIELARGNNELALARFKQIRKEFEDDGEYLADLCLALEKTSQWREALDLHETLHRRGDRGLGRLERMANDYAYVGDPASALGVAEEILAIEENHVGAQLIKIDALIGLQNAPPALELATRLAQDALYVESAYTLEIHRQPWWFYWRLSNSLAALGQPQLAASVARCAEAPPPAAAP